MGFSDRELEAMLVLIAMFRSGAPPDQAAESVLSLGIDRARAVQLGRMLVGGLEIGNA